MAKKKYWIGVASKDQVFVGVRGGFAQLQHGKKIPLQKLHEADWLTYYLPRLPFNLNEDRQSFTSLGSVVSDEIYQAETGDDFLPQPLEVDLQPCEEARILPVIDNLRFIENQKSWAYPFRLGHLEISEEDFQLLAEEMGLEAQSTRH